MIRRKPISLRPCRRCGQATAADTCRSCSSWDQHKDNYEPRVMRYDGNGNLVPPKAEPSLPDIQWLRRPAP